MPAATRTEKRTDGGRSTVRSSKHLATRMSRRTNHSEASSIPLKNSLQLPECDHDDIVYSPTMTIRKRFDAGSSKVKAEAPNFTTGENEAAHVSLLRSWYPAARCRI